MPINFKFCSSVVICNLMRAVEPDMKEVLKTMAAAESLSMGQYVNKALAKHCEEYLKSYKGVL